MSYTNLTRIKNSMLLLNEKRLMCKLDTSASIKKDYIILSSKKILYIY